MISRRALLTGSLALAVPSSVGSVIAKPADARVVLCGDSLAYVMGPAFRAAGKAYGVKVDVWAKGGSSARQWLVKRWFQRVIREHPNARVLCVSLGVNCTRVERPKLAEDISKIVNLVNDLSYEASDERDWESPAVVWLLPPPLDMDTRYLHDAVAKSEVFAFQPTGKIPLEKDGIHPTFEGAKIWVNQIVQMLWM